MDTKRVDGESNVIGGRRMRTKGGEGEDEGGGGSGRRGRGRRGGRRERTKGWEEGEDEGVGGGRNRTCVNTASAGGFVCPLLSLPQHAAVPLLIRPQACIAPAEI
jgi:hypothetical protein